MYLVWCIDQVMFSYSFFHIPLRIESQAFGFEYIREEKVVHCYVRREFFTWVCSSVKWVLKSACVCAGANGCEWRCVRMTPKTILRLPIQTLEVSDPCYQYH